MFEYSGQTNLLFKMAGVELDIGKLALRRITTYGLLLIQKVIFSTMMDLLTGRQIYELLNKSVSL